MPKRHLFLWNRVEMHYGFDSCSLLYRGAHSPQCVNKHFEAEGLSEIAEPRDSQSCIRANWLR